MGGHIEMKKLPIFEDVFEVESGEQYSGVTVLVHGVLQETLDELLKKYPELKNYGKVLVEAISYGLYVIQHN